MSTQDPWAALGAVPVGPPSTPVMSTTSAASDPWAALGAVPVQQQPSKPAFDPMDAVRQAQAARYPTAAEQGGRPGSVAPSPGMMSFYGSQQPETTGQKLMRLYRTGMNTEPQAATGMDQPGIGLMAGASTGGPVTQGMSLARGFYQSPAANIVQAGRQILAGGPVRFIVQSLLRGSKNAEREALAFDAAPQLSKDVEFLTAKTEKQVDDIILKRYQAAKTGLDAAEEAIPAGTIVTKQPLLNSIESLLDKYRVAGEATTRQVSKAVQSPSSIYGGLPDTRVITQQVSEYASVNEDALKTIRSLRDEIAKLPDKIPFEDLRTLRQKLDDAIRVSGGWKEAATFADKAMLAARRDVANSIRTALSDVSPQQLKAANQAYAQSMDLLNAARIDPTRAYRIGTLAEQTSAQRALATGAKIAAGGAGLGAAERLYREWVK